MRRRLIAVSLAVTAMMAIAFVLPLAGLVRELSRSRAVTEAERDSQLVAQLLSVAGHPDGVPGALAALGIDGRYNGRDLTLILPDGSVTGPAVSDSEDLTSVLAGASGQQGVEGGIAVYAPIVTSTGTFVVRIFVPSAELDRNVVRSWTILGLLGAFLVGIGVVAADRLGRSLVRPVEALSDAARRLGEGDLSVRVDPSGPDELIEVGDRFNQLAGRVHDLIQEERETAANLSHRLRTPMTVLKLDIESLADTPEKERLVGDFDELERTVDHVIGEARRVGRQGRSGMTDLREVATDRARFWEVLADEQGRRAVFVDRIGSPTAAVRVPRDDLEAAIDALIGNVFAHTSEPTAYEISIGADDGIVTLAVDDAGAGLPADVTLERGVSTAGSTGLGLDIARRTAEAAGGRLVAGGSRLGGARVAMELPLARARKATNPPVERFN